MIQSVCERCGIAAKMVDDGCCALPDGWNIIEIDELQRDLCGPCMAQLMEWLRTAAAGK